MNLNSKVMAVITSFTNTKSLKNKKKIAHISAPKTIPKILSVIIFNKNRSLNLFYSF